MVTDIWIKDLSVIIMTDEIKLITKKYKKSGLFQLVKHYVFKFGLGF